MKNMKRNFKSFIIACLIVVFYFSLSATFADSSDDKTITTPYDYPVVPKTQEWKNLNSRDEKAEVCDIPVSILNNMTTEALVETVMNYPLLVDIAAWDTPQEGFNALYESFNGLQELTKRPDVVDELKRYQQRINAFDTEDYKIVAKRSYVEILLQCININNDINKEDIIYPMWSNSYVTTPRGTMVSTKYNVTWDDLGGTKAINECAAQQAALLDVYDSGVVVGDMTPAYNCHSYVWYSTSASNKHNILNPSAYMTDGSYISSSTCMNGNRVYYGVGDHSAIVINAASPTIRVRSKWGAMSVIEHDLLDCPYTQNGYHITYWKLNPNEYKK